MERACPAISPRGRQTLSVASTLCPPSISNYLPDQINTTLIRHLWVSNLLSLVLLGKTREYTDGAGLANSPHKVTDDRDKYPTTQSRRRPDLT
ncbi:hypothetical protein PoB_000370800 [Plakobranchus ocellatus]|uniref:Uncharacterized protein n=1 Tax=Plakobranchus ocellatus TaxID=259542 RepID=A0AAV3Y4B3_9GAST|nr:hypothetical protein PoB_000370800 [Plakobranchus ocellatus]